MRVVTLLVIFSVLTVAAASRSAAQDAPPRIGPFVFDVHGTMPRFPRLQQLADSRSLLLEELPGAGLGLHAGAHVYLFKWRAVTFGVGADVAAGRSRQPAQAISADVVGRATTETFTHVAPQVSFNFGDGDGWSYISGGIGPGKWSVVPDGQAPTAADTEPLTTINYGGGARWFIKEHLAFSLDVRFYAINPSAPLPGKPGGPRKTLLIFGAGISVK